MSCFTLQLPGRAPIVLNPRVVHLLHLISANAECSLLDGGGRRKYFGNLICGISCCFLVSITMADFGKVEMKVGKITSVDDIPTARKPIYKLVIDFGDGMTKQCAAGIKDRYTKDELMGKVVVAVVNLEPKPVAGVLSECMLLTAFNEKELSLLTPDKEVTLGTKVS